MILLMSCANILCYSTMSKRILIDLMKCRECEVCSVECAYPFHPDNNGMNTLLELAAFQFTCRRCEDAPCIEVCPAEALERNREGIVERAVNLCVACKSCVTACPFGTLMNHLFDIRKSICNYCHFDASTASLRCIDTCHRGAITFTDQEPDADKYIFALNEHVLIREYAWENLKESD